MAIDDEDFKRRRALAEICGITRHGVVGGVEFDFRHELLEPREWQMETIGTDSPLYCESAFAPFIWCPWYGEFSKAQLRREANLDDESDEKMLRDPECIINVGDKITIKNVDRQFIEENNFGRAHDYEVRFALLNVIRSNDKIEEIKTPVRFTSMASIFTGDSTQFLDKILRRVRQHFHVRSLEKVSMYEIPEKDGGRFAAGTRFYAETLARRLVEFKKLAGNRKSDNPHVSSALDACYIADEAAYVGYLWARAEAEINLKPLVRSALRVKIGATSGGAKSGAVRRQKRAASWEPIAKEMAKGIRTENPTFSQEDVASEIEAGWKATTCDPPVHSTLKALISRMEQAGELPKRQRI